ncbi:cupredoxin domain-containing protein [Microbacterium stercoris]|uniref:Cupredoxin domain-containing protein n=1 Tax=Microbacterium stercoris TaxID=2820289 RepID=A0A939QU71_9MICO|nr:cupredoxin domain-containing protein [Microbacterium stercoris]MBO3664751.1 cupredoxin domain-containing protein [Microbacterium stercoris]
MRRPVPTLIAAAVSLLTATGLVACTIGGAGQTEGALAASHEHAGHTPSTHTVAIRDLAFTPSEIEVAAGDTVAWSFDDEGMLHHVEATDGEFESPIQGEGSFSATFEEPGEHRYVCSIHPYMTGVVRIR